MTITTSQFLGEMIGSFTLIALGVGISMNLTLKKSFNMGNTSAISGPLSWGFAVAMAIIVAMPFDSGAHFNPAVTVGFAVAGVFPWGLVFPYIVAQAIGSFLGAIASWFVYKCQFDETADDPYKTRIVFCTNAAVRNPLRNFANEALATFFLIFISLLMVAPHIISSEGSNVPLGRASLNLGANGAIVNGFLIFAIGMAYGGVTGWSLNPTRDLMPRLVHQILPIKGKEDSDWGYGIRNGALAPMVGAIIAAGFYLLIKDYLAF